MSGFVYLRSEPGLWTVGFYTLAGGWIAESVHDSTPVAATGIAYLSGVAAARSNAATEES
jgi:hypothetical protein